MGLRYKDLRVEALPDLYDGVSDLAAIMENIAALHPSRDVRLSLPDPAGLAARMRLLLAKARGE